ncbi:hypothetical protein OXPF_03820 [Oxobacter pfennigii]|uniref:Uncharacterized protein n=1 Tax=Oxobacter pfennigii TaxID=36849 RepID=A0A0P8WTF0_9CLOT|nr:hypothetical protein [Oxobacter pfennigii]KPU45914.1 hypothetical protein OXPF_03820 [Oxobacter pfennigii]
MMRVKILLILVLIGAAFVSSTVGTLSNYTSESSFSVEVAADLSKDNQRNEANQVQEQAIIDMK